MSPMTCDECGSPLGVDYVRGKISTGFGRHNKEWYDFCDVECRAFWRGEDPVIARTVQLRLDELDRLDLEEDKITAGDVQAARSAVAAGGAR